MSFTKKNALRVCAALLLGLGTMAINSFGQPTYTRPTTASPTPKPYVQDIQVQPTTKPTTTNPTTSATPLVNTIASVSPAYPVLNDVAIPGYSGILVETLDGKTIVDSYSNYAFNPASNVKVATAYAVLKSFGPDYRFQTSIWTDGQIDQNTRTLNGNLYISGRDPMFNLEHGVNVAYELNKLGVSTITGDLVVTDNFAMNYNMSPVSSGNNLLTVMDAGRRNAAAVKAWQNYLYNSGKSGSISLIPSVSFGGSVYVQPMPSNVRQLFTHESAPLREIVKVTLCYSNNFLAERLGDMIGGPSAVARTVTLGATIPPQEFLLQTSSGLGINRVTPKAMMKLLRALRVELARWKMSFADIMPVAGIDKGTLEGRFDSDFARGSVVGKTGTLGNTDAGVSALSGEIGTRGGTLLFVIFNQKGSVPRFRAFQNNYVSLIQGQFGGAAPVVYSPVALDVRLANTRILYPDGRARIN
ncbi:MAG: D-alanyl-D-alanine carboxypeptidase [Acidobacteria bacterium]|nr:D-alanyl-D-alanine carboxypeptidase [Acidobacteriota bacterium]